MLGDWNCDGTDTVGIYRPADGQVVEFDDWPGLGGAAGQAPAERPESTAVPRATGIVEGVASVEAGGDGCDRVVVEPGR